MNQREELIRELATLIAGLQMPLSLGLPLGVADAPLRLLLDKSGFGWKTPEDIEAWLYIALGEA